MRNGEPAPKKVPKRRRAPGVRSFAVGAVASVVAVFSVLAFRVHEGEDPAIASTKATNNATTTTSSTTTASDPYDYGDDSSSSTSSDDSGSSSSSSDNSSSGSVSSTPQASTSAS